MVISVYYLIHAESQDPKWAESLRYGFSTKIADSISSGKIFIMYSSSEIAGASYVQENGAGIFASSPLELKKKLDVVLNSEYEQTTILNKARLVADKNHDIEKNIKKMRDYLAS